MVVLVQGLGRVDELLRSADARIAPYAARKEDPPGMELTIHLTQSHLWVMGVYEITRTVAQRGTMDPSLFSEQDLDRIQGLKKQFARIRVPLAKLEPAGAHRHTDYAFPWPGFSQEHGVFWELNPGVAVSRGGLADSFVDLFESIQHSR